MNKSTSGFWLQKKVSHTIEEGREMNKSPRSLIIIATVVFLLATPGVQDSHGQGRGKKGKKKEEEKALTFPGSHKDFLGASSYRALFGLNAGPVEPGPHSSDTGTGRPPRVGPNTQVNDPQTPFPGGLLGRSETTIAASANGDLLVVGWNDADGFCGPPFGAPCPPPSPPGLSGYGFSADGGKSWTDGGAPFVGSTIALGPGGAPFSTSGDYITRGDPSLDVGGFGNDSFFYANLAVFDDFLGSTAGISVHIGRFTNKAFAWFNAVLLQSPNFPFDFLDKELLATDARRPHVYVSVTNFIEVGGIPQFGFGQIEAYSSTDEGATWSRSIIQSDETISVPLNEGIINQGSMPAVGPDGTVYVAWERGWLFPFFQPGFPVGVQAPQIVVAKSTDNGATFGSRVLVSDICSGALFPPQGYNRGTTNDFPRIAVALDGPNVGRVYVTYQDCRIANGGPQSATGGFGNPDTDIYVSFSDDAGATWSAPTLVAGGGDGLIQFWPTISVARGGNVDVTYYESLEGGGTSMVDYVWNQSIDGGSTWEAPVIVSEVTTDWGSTATNISPNFGDYNTAVSVGDRLFTTWADGRNGVPDTFFSKVKTIGKAPR